MKQKPSRYTIFLILFSLLIIPAVSFLRPYAAEPDTSPSGRILFISSYSYGWDTVQIQIEGIKAGIGSNVVLDYEFMDTKRVDTETSRRQFYEGLAYRLSIVEPYDVVILGDDAALLFALEYRDELFDGIPLIFEGINDEQLAIEVSKDPLISGVLEKLSFQKNIDFARTLFPNASKVIGIFDDTLTGQAERNSFYQNSLLYPDLTFSDINTSALTTEELKNALANISNDSILIYVVMTQDASGKSYTNLESIRLISEYACVPAFRMVSGGIGDGLLGGNIVSMELSGKLAADMAMQILSGTDPSYFDVVVDSPNIYCVDEAVMKRFGISLSLIPDGAAVINHTPTFWEQYSGILVPVFLIILCLLLFSVWLFIDNRKRRRLVVELKSAQQKLKDLNEHDFLTGLPNRTKFTGDLENCLKCGLPYSLVMLDIDNFKKINDSFGHDAGDRVLRELGHRLFMFTDDVFTPYRFAGDEFILILKTADDTTLLNYLSKCASVFEEPILLQNEAYNVGGSFGAASYPQDAETAEQLIICADRAMYFSKTHGKNMLSFYRDIENADGK